MLNRLFIQNYAIIDHLQLEFSEHLSIITGETGAGKSILLGALSLLQGKRADTSVLFDPGQKCIIEGTFMVKAYSLHDFFEEHSLDYDDHTIIRREISANGKSRSFINDTPVNLQVLKKLGSFLMNIHSQHETLELATDDFQLLVVDSIATHQKQLLNYRADYNEYSSITNRLRELIDENARMKKELDFLEFQFKELEDSGIENEDEQETLEQELKLLSNAEEIRTSLHQCIQSLQNGEFAALPQLNSSAQKLQQVAQINPNIQSLAERMESLRIELQDINFELESMVSGIHYDDSRINEITERLDIFYRLQKKHFVQSLKELIDFKRELEEKIGNAANFEQHLLELENKKLTLEKSLKQQALQLSDNRKTAIKTIEEQVNKMLPLVGMKNARLSIEHSTESQRLTKDGIDQIDYLFTANLGALPQPVRKIASGGELSRLMLTIKSMVARSTALPTLIFDEIDTGISGEVALKVGHILRKISNIHQVICITHLPQIAGIGHKHYLIYKINENNRTYTKMKTLQGEERIVEIAKMLSGDKPGAAAIQNAKDLLAANSQPQIDSTV